MVKKKKKSFSFRSLWVSLIVAIGGLLFGYYTGIISGALLFITQEMHLSVIQQELVVSTVLIGALVGAWIGGMMSDHFGRKFTLFVTSFLFVIGTIFLYFAKGMDTLLLGRFISGIGVGIASLTVPLYIAEVSSPNVRGMFVSFNQLAVVIGILVAYAISYTFSLDGDWRWMFGIGFIPSFALFIGLFFIPETPAWLVSKGKGDKAKRILKKLRPYESYKEVFHEEAQKKNKKQVGWKHLLDKSVKPALLVGIGISVFQQITGINTVFYYAPKIFELAGFHGAPAATLATFGLGIVNVIVTIIAIWLIDKAGRRPLLIVGLSGMVLSLLSLATSFYLVAEVNIGLTAVISLMFYVAFFAFSLGPIAWLIISEIYPTRVRGRAMGIATFSNWIMNYIVSLTFLSLIEWLGKGGTFILYAIIGLFALWFVVSKVPETKGKKLIDIQNFWKKA